MKKDKKINILIDDRLLTDAIDYNKSLPADSVHRLPYYAENFWVASPDFTFAKWQIDFANSSREDLGIYIIEKLLVMGQTHNILNGNLTLKADLSFWDMLQRMFLGEERMYAKKLVQKFRRDLNISPQEAKFPSEVHYFSESGLIRKAMIADLGQILKATSEQYPDQYKQSVAPVCLEVSYLPKSNTASSEIKSISLVLHTDIWFPWVAGLGRTKEAQQPPIIYDNRHLAMRHTHKLNDFLSGMYDVSINSGAAWKCDRMQVPDLYKSMVQEKGIALDIDLELPQADLDYI